VTLAGRAPWAEPAPLARPALVRSPVQVSQAVVSAGAPARPELGAALPVLPAGASRWPPWFVSSSDWRREADRHRRHRPLSRLGPLRSQLATGQRLPEVGRS
jgi:hypothetical protein